MKSILVIVMMTALVFAQQNEYSTGQFAEAQQAQQPQQPQHQIAHHVLADPALLNSYADSYKNTIGELNIGRNLFEGDILLTKRQSDYIEKSQLNDGLAIRAIVKDVQKLWPDRDVPYAVSDDLRDESKEYVKSAIKEWKKKTCVKLRPKTDSDTDYIEFVYDGGCSSYVGKIGGHQTISVGADDGSITCKHGNIVHELAHSLGFFHEHSRPDRDKHIKVVYDNVMDGYERNFRKESFKTIDSQGVDYDYDSVMHYGAFFFTKTDDKKTIVTSKDGAAIGQRVGLSDLDIEQARLLYGCDKDSDSAPSENYYHSVVKSKVQATKHGKKTTKAVKKSKKITRKSTHLKKAVKLFIKKSSKKTIRVEKKTKSRKAFAKTQIISFENQSNYDSMMVPSNQSTSTQQALEPVTKMSPSNQSTSTQKAFEPVTMSPSNQSTSTQQALEPVTTQEASGPTYSQAQPAAPVNVTFPTNTAQALAPAANQEAAATSTNQQASVITQKSGSTNVITVDAMGEENRGQTYFEGDMILSEDQRQYLESLKADDNQAVKRALIKNTTYLWPDRAIYYTFDDSVDEIGKENAEAAVKHWQESTCLEFKHRTSEKDYINFVFEGGCASRVGRGGGMQKLTIGSTELRCKKGNIIHEMGHALGFFHEHSRPDRDDFVKVHPKNILPGFERNFLKFSTRFIDSLNVPYDYGSIMHYGKNFFSKLAMLSIPTMTITKELDEGQDIEIGQRVALSDMDILQANLLYKCDGRKRLSDDERGQLEGDYADPTVFNEGPCGDTYDVRSCTTVKSMGYCQKYPRTLRRACGNTCQLCSIVPPNNMMHVRKKSLLSKLKLSHTKKKN